MRTPGVLAAAMFLATAGCRTPEPPAWFDGESQDGWVYVSGDVAKPGRVPVVRGRLPFTLLEALALAEPVGEPRFVECTRPGVGLLTYDVDAVLHGVIDDPALEPDDVVTVSARR